MTVGFGMVRARVSAEGEIGAVGLVGGWQQVYGCGGQASLRVRITPWGGSSIFPSVLFFAFPLPFYGFFSVIGDQKTQVKYLIPIG